MKTLLISFCLIALAFSSQYNEERACIMPDEQNTHYDIDIGGPKCILVDAVSRSGMLVFSVDRNTRITASTDTRNVTLQFILGDPNSCSRKCFTDDLYEIEIFNVKHPNTPMAKEMYHTFTNTLIKFNSTYIQQGSEDNCNIVTNQYEYSCDFKVIYKYTGISGSSIAERDVNVLISLTNNVVVADSDIVVNAGPKTKFGSSSFTKVMGRQIAGVLERWDSSGYDGQQITGSSSAEEKKIEIGDPVYLQLYASNQADQVHSYSVSDFVIVLKNGDHTEIDITSDVVGRATSVDVNGDGNMYAFRVTVGINYIGQYSLKIYAQLDYSRRRILSEEQMEEDGVKRYSEASIPIDVVGKEEKSDLVLVLVLISISIGALSVSGVVFYKYKQLKDKRYKSVQSNINSGINDCKA